VQALGELADAHAPLLGQFSGHLANVLDHLESFSTRQLGQVFGMFAALTARRPVQGGGVAVAGDATRLADELAITLTKALGQPCPGFKRIGVLGSLALLRQDAMLHELLGDTEGTAAGGVVAVLPLLLLPLLLLLLLPLLLLLLLLSPIPQPSN
jgi:hypothetical protein